MNKKFFCFVLMVFLLATTLAFSTSAAEFKIKWGMSSAPDYFFNRAAKDTMDYIEEKTNGNIEFEFFPNNSLGKEAETVEMVSLGTVDIFGMGAQFAQTYSENIGVVSLPFLIKDYGHMQRVLKSGMLDDMLKQVEDKANVKVMCWSLAGVRHITTDDVLVRTPEDLKGVKLRCMPSPFYKDVVASFGATPTPVAYSELYMALQTGVVQGQENPVTAIFDSKFYEVQNYLMLTGHEFYGGWIVFSKMSWDKLSEQYQQIIEEAFEEVYVPKCYEYFNEDENKMLGALAKKGMNIIIPDKEAFRNHSTEYMMEKYGDKWGDLIEAIKNVN